MPGLDRPLVPAVVVALGIFLGGAAAGHGQGLFEILPRDQAPGISEESQIATTVRVVSTIDYMLRG